MLYDVLRQIEHNFHPEKELTRAEFLELFPVFVPWNAQTVAAIATEKDDQLLTRGELLKMLLRAIRNTS